ncbi:hypothetical protein F8388_024171, partial [Cannabis sativa]
LANSSFSTFKKEENKQQSYNLFFYFHPWRFQQPRWLENRVSSWCVPCSKPENRSNRTPSSYSSSGKRFRKFLLYDSDTRGTIFVIKSEKGYEILKLGDQNWRPLQPDFRKGQPVLKFKDKDREKLVFFYLVRTRQQQAHSFYWESDPAIAIGELSKEHGLRVLVMKNDYSWNEQVIEICSPFLNQHLIPTGIIPVAFVNTLLWFRYRKHNHRNIEYCYDTILGRVMGSKEV